MTAPLSLCHGRHLPPARRHPRPWPSGRRSASGPAAGDRPGPHSEDLALITLQALGRSSPRAQDRRPLASAASALPRGAPAPPSKAAQAPGPPSGKSRGEGRPHRRRHLSRRPRRRRVASLSPVAGKIRACIFCLLRSQRGPPEPGALSRMAHMRLAPQAQKMRKIPRGKPPMRRGSGFRRALRASPLEGGVQIREKQDRLLSTLHNKHYRRLLCLWGSRAPAL